MKNLHLKIFSLFIISILSAGIAFAYQTIAFDFPPNTGNWIVVYHRTGGNETIIQYVPSGQTFENWYQAVIIHSYRNSSFSSARNLLKILTNQLEKLNAYSRYVYQVMSDDNAVATRCVVRNSKMPSQCDIYRAMTSFNGYITIQYINRNVEGFKGSYLIWMDAIKKAAPYYSEFRNDRYMSKDNFEL